MSSNETSSAFFFFNDTATTEIYTLSLHDALPISPRRRARYRRGSRGRPGGGPRDPFPRGSSPGRRGGTPDRKSTRLNSSHANISYAVFCLKKKKQDVAKLHHITLHCLSRGVSHCS